MWNKPDPAMQIIECLEREYIVLKSGEFSEISSLSAKKAELLKKLQPNSLKPATSELIGKKASRNRLLMEEVMRALKEVAARLRSAGRTDVAFSSYTAIGSSVSIGCSSTALSKKL